MIWDDCRTEDGTVAAKVGDRLCDGRLNILTNYRGFQSLTQIRERARTLGKFMRLRLKPKPSPRFHWLFLLWYVSVTRIVGWY